MAVPVTEVATVPLQPSVKIGDAHSPASEVSVAWKDFLTVVSAQDGFQRCYFGRQVEDPHMLDLFIDWDSLKAHENFKASPIYSPFVKQFMTMAAGPITLVHAHFSPHPPSAVVTSPSTLVITAYFHTLSTTYATGTSHVLEAMKSNAAGCTAIAQGWIIEEVANAQILGPGVKGRAYVACIGWENIERHMVFEQTERWRGLLSVMKEGPVGVEMHHTTFRGSGKG